MRVTFVIGQALGHVGRALNVARALRELRSCDITFAGNNPGRYFEKCLSPEGFATVPIGIAAEPSPRAYALALTQVLSTTMPDVVVYDLSPVPWLLFAAAPPVPQVYLTNYFLTRVGDGLTVQDEIFAANSAQINATRHQLGLEPLGSARELYERDRVILADPVQLLPDSAALPRHYLCAGAIWWEPEVELPAELQELSQILYVSLGSTGAHVPAAVLARLAGQIGARHVVLASTRASATQHASSMPISSYSNIPGSAVLSRSVFAITQGGAGSCYQALHARVPLGIWPAHRNHRLLGQRLMQLGVAFPLHPGPLDGALGAFVETRPAVMQRLQPFASLDATEASRRAAAAIADLFQMS